MISDGAAYTKCSLAIISYARNIYMTVKHGVIVGVEALNFCVMMVTLWNRMHVR